MSKSSDTYTLGIWSVKSGKEADFISAWKSFAQWTSEHQLGTGDARLLQDSENPNRFISFGPWENTERIKEWRARPEFAAFFAKARELCDDIKPHVMQAVAHISSR